EKHAMNLPIRRGEMFSGKFSRVFPDVASSRIWVKKSLREYENKVLTYEKFATISSLTNSNGIGELRECWNKILFLAFHDVVPGTGMDTVYEEVKQHVGFLKSWLSYSMPRILNSIVENDTNNKNYGDVVVFNPLSWDVLNWVEVDLEFNKGQIYKIEGLQSGDEETEVEVIRFSRNEDESLKTARIGFVANVPAIGYKVYKIKEREAKNEKETFIRIVGNTIETKFFNVTFFPDTGLIEVSKNGKKICEGNNLVIEGELGDLYYHKEDIKTPIKTESGEGLEKGSFKVNNFWIDKSPLRRVINIETDYFSLKWPYRLLEKLEPMIWRHRSIRVKKKIIVYKDIPRIDFVTIVENKHPRMRLRVRFDTEIKNSKYTCETAFGAITRKTNQYYAKA
ncbi:glycoside hydrolase, partial [Patescibacteria group bacterium]|nr:glycoside hydrolase [Patescibacteria group bacterium]